jgi:hypothetical protein
LQLLFVALVAAVLCLPMLIELFATTGLRPGENRAPVPPPLMPKTLAEVALWPAKADAYLKDYFGLRSLLVDLHDQILFHIFGAFNSSQVLSGRRGRIFLASHSAATDTQYSLIQTSCGFGIPQPEMDAAIKGWAEVLRRATARSQDARLIIVPSAAALYPEQLPTWLFRQCEHGVRPAEAIARGLPPFLQPRLTDPFPIMKNMHQPAIPVYNFHWDGRGPKEVAEWLSENVLGRHRAFALTGDIVHKPSDLTGFFPGVRLDNEVFEPNVEAAHVTACYGSSCFPRLGSAGAILEDMRRYHGPAAEGRLLLITDSFGAFVASDLTPYFRDVWQTSINNIHLLTPAQKAQFRETFLAEYRPETVLLLFHDGAAIFHWMRILDDVYPQ